MFITLSFCTIYLSPRDYHRIHMPVAGKLQGMRYIPGYLYSVSPATAAKVPDLFARNERLVCFWETETFGNMAMVMVGAVNVAALETAWHGAIARSKQVSDWSYPSILIPQGAEIGRFNLGSTVILLTEKPVSWQPLATGESMRLFQTLL